MPVIDASALVAYLTRSQHVAAVRDELARSPGPAAAPYLVDAEVGHALRGLVVRSELSVLAADSALDALKRMRLRRCEQLPLLSRAWELRGSVSFYEGLYLALAELLQTPLLTLDARLGQVPGTVADVRVLA